ncbi:OsmC family protein [Streptomyces rimosus]|uniref:OsmC family protein n=1 Tax=Streptomyces rimosus TaxID=1927 RepID=UPI000AA36A3C|nr:OsmC family protein [Streptomyces rimosus]
MIVDQPVPAEGDDRGPTPVELFVTALAACVAYYAGSFLKRHGLTREGLRVIAEFDMTKGPPARVRSVLVRVVPPMGLGTAQREALRAVTNHCTVGNSLRLPPEVSVVVDGPGVSSVTTA